MEAGIELPFQVTYHQSLETEPASRCELVFRHSGWASHRQVVYDALKRNGTGSNRLAAFCSCGAGVRVEKDNAGKELRLVACYCHDRWCVPCANARAQEVARTLKDVLNSTHARFATFTLRHSDTPLADQINRLFRSFKELRRRRWWKDNVEGGIAIPEIKISSRDGRWHPHLHVLVTSGFLPHKELAAEWHAVTGDSSIVDIRPIGDGPGRVNYMVKYLTKPASPEVWADQEKLDEMMIALRGRHMLLPFGTWRKLLQDATDADEHDDEKWENVGRLSNIIGNARGGDNHARSVLEALQRKYPGLTSAYDLPPPGEPWPARDDIP